MRTQLEVNSRIIGTYIYIAWININVVFYTQYNYTDRMQRIVSNIVYISIDDNQYNSLHLHVYTKYNITLMSIDIKYNRERIIQLLKHYYCCYVVVAAAVYVVWGIFF